MTLLTPEISGSTAYYIEARNRGGTLLAFLPYQNIQMEDLINKPGNLRFDVPRNHPKITRDIISEGKTELWLYRHDKLIFAGPLWAIASASDSNTLSLSCNGVLSYLQHRVYDDDRLFDIGSSGGEIGQFLIDYTQDKDYGGLQITYGEYETTAMGYKVMALARERKKILTMINELADNDVTGFDFEITPDRVWNAYPTMGSTKPGVLEYGTTVSHYNMNRYASTIRNDVAARSEGEGESVLIGYASDTTSMGIYGRMEDIIDDTSARSVQGLETKAQYYVQERKTALSTPALTIEGSRLDFLSEFYKGDSVRVKIDNGYDQYDNVTRITGHQLTVGPNDQESVNVYIDIDEEGATDDGS